ncbi:MAG: ATP-binding cassette domain-containing protein [Acetobacteraceae bacterium]
MRFRQRGAEPAPVLQLPSFRAEPGTLWGCRGPSGSGKSTLLYALAGLLRPSAGEVAWGGVVISALPEAARDRWRHATVGIVFQDFHLIPELSALENVLLPARFRRPAAGAALRERAAALLRQTGIVSRARRAGLLSRGEQQRVALARALLLRPALILADEPTASLDAETGATVGALLVDAARESGATLFAVSHDPALLARMQQVLTLQAGRPVEAAP